MVDIEKEIKKEELQLMKFIKKKEFWMIVSAVFAIALIIAIAWPSGVSSGKAGTTLVNSLNERVGGGVTLINISKAGSLYMATVNYQDQEIPVYMTTDGKYMVMGVQELAISGTAGAGITDTTSTEVPKTAKPVVEAFVFSYCPYGLQFEKALSPVYTLLKNKADINIVTIGAMHGEFEKQESVRQMCIQSIYGKDKLWAYLNKFMLDTAIGSCSSDIGCSKPLVEKLMTGLSIDVAKVNACMPTTGETLYNTDVQRAASLGISGSPGFVINGVEVQVGRNPEAIKQAICSAFIESNKPTECSQTLTTSSATAGFGAGTGAATGATC